MPDLRPRVLVNFASSIDGKITPAPGLRRGAFAMSRHDHDHHRMRQIRAAADAIVIGAGNLRADDPDLALEVEERERRRKEGRRLPHRIVVTRRGDGIAATHKMFNPTLGGASFVLHSEEMPMATRARLAAVATTVAMGEKEVDIPRMLGWMVHKLGVGTLLCEGGGVLCAALFAARAVDELFLTVVPRILGGESAPTLVEGPGFLPDDVPDAKLADVDRIGDELFLRYDFTWD